VVLTTEGDKKEAEERLFKLTIHMTGALSKPLLTTSTCLFLKE
jgi:hypothetical protein